MVFIGWPALPFRGVNQEKVKDRSSGWTPGPPGRFSLSYNAFPVYANTSCSASMAARFSSMFTWV